MNRIKTFLAVISLTTLLSCNQTDFSNPEAVAKKYQNLLHQNKTEELYQDFLSTKSKEFVTKDEYIKYNATHDTIARPLNTLETKILTLPVDINNSSMLRVKIEEMRLSKSDTIYTRVYYTLSNEDGKWKIIWTSTLAAFAKQKFDDENYSEARKTLNKIIEIDPYDGGSYDLLAWCYRRDVALSMEERESGVLKNAKYAVAIEEDIPDHYMALSLYYELMGNSDLQIENIQHGLRFCKNKDEFLNLYCNMACDLSESHQYFKAEECIKNCLKIDSNDTYTWFIYGNLRKEEHNFPNAIYCFKKALSRSSMERYLQGKLFYEYAYCSLKVNNCSNAREYINKALEIDPEDDNYQRLYRQLIDCI